MLSHAVQLQNENKYTVAVAKRNLYLKSEELRTQCELQSSEKRKVGVDFHALTNSLSQLELVSIILTRWHTVALKV
jgi:hypothetical protein